MSAPRGTIHSAIRSLHSRELTENSFNCLLAFSCGQYAECNEFNGKCSCPAGYGGDDCLSPGTIDRI
jgi:hypothetical protein